MTNRYEAAPAERGIVPPRLGRWTIGAGALLILPLAACNFDRAITVKDVDVVTPGQLDTKDALPTLLAATASTFQIAYSGGGDLSNGGHEGEINLSGLMSDELLNSETFPDRIAWDQRSVRSNNASLGGVFTDLSLARAFGELASDRFNRFDPDNAGHAEVLALAGFAYVLFAENFCSGVPASTLNADGTVDYGDPLSRDELLQRAVAKFDSALNVADATDRETNLARVGKGRALVDLGQFADAATAVADVPTDYAYLVEHSSNSTREWNGVWNYTGNALSFSSTDREGGNGLPYITANDPRVPILDIGDVGFDGETPYFLQLKYPEQTSSVVLADGVEARLIEAEAALQASEPGTWLTKLNELRSTAITPALPAIADPGTPAARVDTMFTERAFWLYLTSHRLGDMRRLIRQYGRDAESVFPTGPYFKGGSYGTDVNFPVVAAEQNNPKFHGCLDRNP
jgi:hypothetical protein